MSLFFDGERYHPAISGNIHAEHLHRYCLARGLAEGKDVLDVASGEGYGSDVIACVAGSVVGVDISAITVEHAKQTYRRDNLRFVQGTCAKLPCEDVSFDMVVSFETLEHHNQHEEMLREIRRVLRPDGVFLISSPNRPEFNRIASEPNPFHVKELDFEEFATLVRSYFPNVVFYAQRVMSNSCIAPINVPADDFRHFDVEGGCSSEIPRPIYFLAVASDGPVPSLGASVYEVPNTVLQSEEMGVAEARLYISEIDQGVPQAYVEARGAAVLYPVSSQRQTVRLKMSVDLKPLARIRLDLANRPVALFLHRLSLLNAEGEEVWCWNGDPGLFKGIAGLVIREAPQGHFFLCLNNDPQFDLVLPPEVLNGLQPNACFLVDLTPRPLLQVITEILRQDERHITELDSDAGSSVSGGCRTSSSDSSMPKLQLSQDIEGLATMLAAGLARRDQTLLQQSRQINAMRQELLRAEAQLALLKDLMLGGRDDDRL